MDPLDRCLDEFEALWRSSRMPPDLHQFVTRLPPALVANGAPPELALIDLEQRWRRFFRSGESARSQEPVNCLPRLPTWLDYCGALPHCRPSWIDGARHEFYVRQLFGDRPNCQAILAAYPEIAAELAGQLPALAAELTGAEVRLIYDGDVRFACALPGRLEVGRRRIDEPRAPVLVETQDTPRLLAAELGMTCVSRSQLLLEVVAKDRVAVRHIAAKGHVDCVPGGRLLSGDSCEVQVPCELVVYDVRLRIVRP